MTIELHYLIATLFLAIVQIFIAAVAPLRAAGATWNAGPRDGPPVERGRIGGRLERARANLYETLPIFIALVLVAHVTGAQGPLTLWGAALYFWARLFYIPLYAFGVPWLRSLVFGIGMIGLTLLFVAVLRPL